MTVKFDAEGKQTQEMMDSHRLKKRNADGPDVIADILRRDRQRMVFFRQIGQMADQYIRRNVGATHRRLLQDVDDQQRRFKTITTQKVQQQFMVPFPDQWMTSILNVIHPSIIRYCFVTDIDIAIA